MLNLLESVLDLVEPSCQKKNMLIEPNFLWLTRLTAVPHLQRFPTHTHTQPPPLPTKKNTSHTHTHTKQKLKLVNTIDEEVLRNMVNAFFEVDEVQ
jgi:hypothetical protein